MVALHPGGPHFRIEVESGVPLRPSARVGAQLVLTTLFHRVIHTANGSCIRLTALFTNRPVETIVRFLGMEVSHRHRLFPTAAGASVLPAMRLRQIGFNRFSTNSQALLLLLKYILFNYCWNKRESAKNDIFFVKSKTVSAV